MASILSCSTLRQLRQTVTILCRQHGAHKILFLYVALPEEPFVYSLRTGAKAFTHPLTQYRKNIHETSNRVDTRVCTF
jgi:hypothetical protein